MKVAENTIYKKIPNQMNSDEILYYIQNNKIDGTYFNMMSNLSKFDDNEISALVNIDVKTFRKYKNDNTLVIKSPLLIEYTVSFLSLLKHGVEVFGSMDKFKEWLQKDNFFFNKKPPYTFLSTISGIQHVDDRLTGLEYGDNA